MNCVKFVFAVEAGFGPKIGLYLVWSGPPGSKLFDNRTRTFSFQLCRTLVEVLFSRFKSTQKRFRKCEDGQEFVIFSSAQLKRLSVGTSHECFWSF